MQKQSLQIFLQIFGLWVISYICVFRKDNIRSKDVRCWAIVIDTV